MRLQAAASPHDYHPPSWGHSPLVPPLPQYPHDSYPPFASGCGFALSRDLVRALLAQPLPDYRLLVGAVGTDCDWTLWKTQQHRIAAFSSASSLGSTWLGATVGGVPTALR